MTMPPWVLERAPGALPGGDSAVPIRELLEELGNRLLWVSAAAAVGAIRRQEL